MKRRDWFMYVFVSTVSAWCSADLRFRFGDEAAPWRIAIAGVAIFGILCAILSKED